MSSRFMMLSVLICGLSAQAGNYAFFEPDGTGSRLWSYAAGWYTCGDYKNDVTKYRGNISALGAAGDGKIIEVDSNLLTPDQPLKIDDGRFVTVGQIYLGSIVGQPYGDEPHRAALEVGEGSGLVTANLTSTFEVGSANGAQGLLLVDSASVVSNCKFRVGASGDGIVTNRGGYVWTAQNNSGYGCYIGYKATGVGHYAQTAGFSDMRVVEIGCEGTGTLEFIGGGARVVAPKLGSIAGGRGTYIVHDGAAVTNGNVTVGYAENSAGVVDLKGGAFFCDSIGVRNESSAYGAITGWGRLYRPSSSAVCAEMNSFTMNGQVVADAHGVDGRMLDFRLARCGNGGANNVKTTIANGADGTNGWYAVNRGVLAYPLVKVSAAEYTGTFGDQTNADCDLVNTVRITYRQTANKGPWLEAQLYAADSDAVPEGLRGQALGVWGFRSNASYDNPADQLGNFIDFALRIRYDHRSLRSGDTVSLLRYDVTDKKWTRLARTTHDAASPYLEAGSLPADGTGLDRNLGVFAVVKEPKGLVLIFR